MSEAFWIRGGTVLDGTGAPPFRGDVLVEGGQISDVTTDLTHYPFPTREGRQTPPSNPSPTGSRESADSSSPRLTGEGQAERGAGNIDATGLYLAPGLIDVHIHTDVNALVDPQQEASLRQGVTTHIIGQDGISFAPASPATMAYMRAYFAAINTIPNLEWNWSSVKQYLDVLDGHAAVNFAYLVPHGNLRMEALGLHERAPNADELGLMCALAQQGMDEGAVGFSTGLDYLPGAYGDTQELIALGRAVGARGGVYVTHIRQKRLGLGAAMEEAFAISRAAQISLHISHLNGPSNVILPMLERAQSEGLDVTFDTYCYLASCTILSMHILPEWVQAGGPQATLQRLGDARVRQELRPYLEDPAREADQLQLTFVPGHGDEEGMRLTDAARRAGSTVSDFICDRLIETAMQVCALRYQSGQRTERDMVEMMQHPAQMAGSDGIFSGSHPHPRGYGCFARYLAYHTRERGDYDWAQAVWHLSGHAAQRYGLRDRGRIKKGFAADIVVFDPARIQDRATFESGHQFADGVVHVIVNGTRALENGRLTDKFAGRALR